LLVAIDGGRQDAMFVQLERADDGDFYRINSAFPASRNYLIKQQRKGMKLLWGGSEPASPVAGQQALYAGSPIGDSGRGAPIAQGQSSDLNIAQKSESRSDRDPLTARQKLALNVVQKTADKFRAEYAGAAALGSLTGAETQRDVEGMRQQGIAAEVLAKRRGQDMSFAAQQQQQGLAARAQEQNAALGTAKLGIEQARLGMDQSTVQRQQSAQDNLAKAMESGDQNAIARARAMASAAGVRLDQPAGVRDRFLTLNEKDSDGNSREVAFDPNTGQTMRPSGAVPNRPVGATSKVGDRIAVWDGTKWVEKT